MREQVKFWREPQFGNLELLHARYITHAFSRNTHDTYPMEVIEQGSEEFAYRGETYVTPAGDVAIINPGEVHTGHAVDETGWTYRVLYPDPSILVQAACEASGRKQEIPFFPPVIQDKQLAQLLWRLHTALECLTSKLEQDSRLLWTLAQLITRHADSRIELKSVGKESQSVKRIRDYLEANYSENVTLEQLLQSNNVQD